MKKLFPLILITLFVSGCYHPKYQVYKRSLLNRMELDSYSSSVKRVDIGALRGYFNNPLFSSRSAEISYHPNPFKSGLLIRVFESNSSKVHLSLEISGVFTYTHPEDKSNVRIFAEFRFLEGSTWENRYSLGELFVEKENLEIRPVRFESSAILKTPHDYSRTVTQGDSGKTIELISFKSGSLLRDIMPLLAKTERDNGVVRTLSLRGKTDKLWKALSEAGVPEYKTTKRSMSTAAPKSCRSFVKPAKLSRGSVFRI